MDKKLINEPQHIKDLTDIELCEKLGIMYNCTNGFTADIRKFCFELMHENKISIDYIDDFTMCYPFQNMDAQNDDTALLSVSDINPCRAVLMAVVWKNEVVK